MHALTSYCRVSGDYGFLINSGCAVVCLQSKSIKKKKSIDETDVKIFQVGLFPLFNDCNCHRVTFVAINSKTSQVDVKSQICHGFFIF